MHFLSPAWLLLLLVVAALLAVYVLLQFRRTHYVARFSNVELLGSITPRRPGWRRHLTFALLLIAMTLLSFGVARPSSAVREPRQRATVILAIDVSPSMQATDVLPSRIQAAQDAAKQFTKLLPAQINLGLVDFGGQANLLVSPTTNRQSVQHAIDNLKLQPYTAIGEAIFTSLQAIEVFAKSTSGGGNVPARIVLLSDGSNTVGRPLSQAIAAAKKAHVEISTIAFGTPNGTVTIDGQTAKVPADDPALRSIAVQTGGSFHAAHSEDELKAAYANIGSQIGYTTRDKDISYRFLLAGVLVLFAAGGASMLWSGRLV